MRNIVYCEFIKMKRSFIIPVVLLGGIVIPAFYFFSNLNIDYETIERATSANDILCNINIMQIQFLNTILFSLVGGYVFSREFENQTTNVLFCYPVSRVKIFAAKVIVVFAMILIVYFINFAGSLFTVGTSLGLDKVKNIFLIEFKTCAVSALLQILIIPLTILIGIISRNVILPVVCGVIGSVTSMFMMATDVYMQLSPFMLPVIPFYHFFRGDPIDYIAVSLSGGIVFLGSAAGIILYLRNSDIN